MASVNYRNLSQLKAVETLIHEICRFLDGWGDLDMLLVEWHKKQLTITIEPKEEV